MNPMKPIGRRAFQPDRIVGTRHNGETARLIDVVAKLLGDPAKKLLKNLLRFGQVKLNGEVQTNVNTPVENGSEVSVNLSRPFVVLANPRLKIVYEDDDIIVVNKGYGLLSVGTGAPGKNGKKEETAYSILKDYVKAQNPANKIFVIHRLDKQTSGLMMFAKSIEAKEAMQHNWNNMVLRRTYVSVLDGEMREDSGIIRSDLDENSEFEVYSTKEPGQGKRAATRYRVLGRGNGYTLAEFELDTGRKNQIRVHARDLGHPIVGDHKYGKGAGPLHRLALHAITLRFAHPITRRDMDFSLPIPARFAGMVKRFRSRDLNIENKPSPSGKQLKTDSAENKPTN